MIGPFKKHEAKSLNFPTANLDPMFSYNTSLEIAGVEAFFSLGGEPAESRSHHGRKLLTITYKGKEVVLCERLNPFCAYYIGKTDDMEDLKIGLSSRFDADFKVLGIVIEDRFIRWMDKGKVIDWLERFYNNEDYEGYSHIKIALNHIDIEYDKAYIEKDQIDEEEVKKKIEELRIKYRKFK